MQLLGKLFFAFGFVFGGFSRIFKYFQVFSLFYNSIPVIKQGQRVFLFINLTMIRAGYLSFLFH